MWDAVFGGYEDETEADRESARASTGKKKQAPQGVSRAGLLLPTFIGYLALLTTPCFRLQAGGNLW